MADTITAAPFVRLEAKPGKKAGNQPVVRRSIRSVDLRIFDALSQRRRQGNASRRRARKALAEKAPELFSQPPSIEKLDVLALKLEP